MSIEIFLIFLELFLGFRDNIGVQEAATLFVLEL
jgi:hypothetical protein